MKIKKRIIEIEVNDEYIVGSGVVIGAAGSHNDVIMKVRFNSSWVGLNIYATFRDALGENPIQVVLTAVSTLVESDGDHCVHKFLVPLKAKAYEGKITLSFTGYTVAAVASEDGEGVEYQETQAITSGTAYFNVLKSDAMLADDMFMAANVGQQLHADVETLGKMYGNLNDTLEAISQIQDSLGSTTLTVADLGSLNDAIEGINDFLEYVHPDEQGEANIFDRVYPIGSIYMSTDPTSPSERFGGTWERLTDRFLIGASDNYSGEGGSTNHTHGLTKAYAKFCAATTGDSYYSEYNKSTGNVAEGETFSWTPEYRANDATKYNTFDNPWSISGATELGGKTDTASNLPPYLAVYMWKRINKEDIENEVV